MITTASQALWFLPAVIPICLYVAWSDMAKMIIPNKAVYALVLAFAVLGLLALPFTEYLWRWTHLVVVLVIGIALNAAGAMGAGDAKFAAAAAPFIAGGDLRLLIAVFAANLIAAFATHRLARHTVLRRLAPHWKSWSSGWAFPAGLSLGATLGIYLILGALYGVQG